MNDLHLNKHILRSVFYSYIKYQREHLRPLEEGYDLQYNQLSLQYGSRK